MPFKMINVFWLVLILMTACSPSRPKIIQTYSQLNYTWETGWEAPQETLAVFVQVENADGLEELDGIYIIADTEDVYWKLTKETWTLITRPGENWLGSNQLLFPQKQVLPRGLYRVLVTTKAGERQSSTFNLDVVTLTEAKPVWPQVAVLGSDLLVGRAPPSYALWFYGLEGTLLHQMVLDDPSIPLEQIQTHPSVNRRATRAYLYWYNEREGYGLFLGPFPLVE